MKTKRTITKTLWNSFLIIFLGTLLAVQAHAQIYVVDQCDGTIGKYDATTGATINASLVSGLNYPTGVAVSDGNLFVTNQFGFTVAKYDAATGATINAALISGYPYPTGIAVSGGNLFVVSGSGGVVSKYDATTGAPINTAFVSGLNSPSGIAVSGGNLFVATINSQTVGKYDATTGAAINPSLVSGLFYPNSIAVSGGNLLVAQYGGPIGEYDANTGATINASFVSASSLGIAVSGGKLFVTSYSGCGSPGSVSAYDATTGATINALLVPGVGSPVAIAAVVEPYTAQVQQPINPDGSSVFAVRRGVVPVKFTLTQDGVATCALPPATIALTRTVGGTIGEIDEIVYSGPADTGSNFRISSCQYVYNLSASALGGGTYRVDIKINGQVVGSGIFQLK